MDEGCLFDGEDGDELDSPPHLNAEDECDDVGASNEVDDGNDEADEVLHEAGQILMIYLKDFMCLRTFEISFGRHLNFVTGMNGSGKTLCDCAMYIFFLP